MGTLSSFTRLTGQLMLGPRGELGYVAASHGFQVDSQLTRALADYTVQYLKQYAATPDDHRFRVGIVFRSIQQHPWGSETLRFTDETVRTIYPMGSGTNLTEFQKKKRQNSIHYGTELLLTYALKDSPQVPIYLPVLFDRNTVLSQYQHQTSTTVTITEPLDTPVIEVLNLLGPIMVARRNADAFVSLRDHLLQTLIKPDARRPVEMTIMESGRAPDAGLTSFLAASAPSAATAAPAASVFSDDAHSKLWYNAALHDATCEKLLRYLLQPRQHAEPQDLRQWIRFRNLTGTQQKVLASRCPLYAAPPNATLLEEGTNDQWNLYLLEGQLELVATDGAKKIISGGTDNAHNAIASLKPRKFAVKTLAASRFLWIHEDMIGEVERARPGQKLEQG